MNIVVWTPRLDGKDPEGNEIPALVGVEGDEARKVVTLEIAKMVAAALRRSIGIQALLEPGLGAVCREGLFVALEGDDQIATPANQVPVPKGRTACYVCHQPLQGSPYVHVVCKICEERLKVVQ